MRLQKYLSEHGICSRRRAEEHILAGRVRVNGEVVTAKQVKELAELEAKIIKAVSKIEDDQLKIDEEVKRIEATRKKWEEIMQKMSDDNRQKLQDYAELLLLKQTQGGRGD